MKIITIYYILFLLILIQHNIITAMHNNQRIVIKKALKTHFSEKKSHRCLTCDKHFSSSSSLARHKKIHIPEKPYQCPTCPQKFSDNSNCKRHIVLAHTDNKPYTCLICNKQYKQKQTLTAHNDSNHTHESLHQPIICNKKFKQFNEKSNYNIPTFVYTPLESLPFAIDIQLNSSHQVQYLLK